MIKQLEIENIALIDKLLLDFNGGLTAFSGETGSGKSIILDSLSFVLGERADKSLIKHGQNKAKVTVVFETTNESTMSILEELGFEKENLLIISRTLTLDGKNECRLNGKLCSTSMLKQVSSTLVDIFGQSQHLGLLKVDNHLKIIDGFCDFGDDKANLKTLFAQYKSIITELKSFGGSDSERERMIDVLSYQIDEIIKANLSVEEETELETFHKRIVNLEKFVGALNQANDVLFCREDSAISLLSKAQRSLQVVSSTDDEVSKLAERINSLLIDADDIARSIEDIVSKCDYDEFEIDKAETRLEKIRTLKRKYGGSVQKALDFLDDAQKQYDNLTNSAERITDLQNQKEIVLEKMYSISKTISKTRKHQAEIFTNQIESQLADLGMAGATLVVNFQESPSFEEYENSLSQNGFDKIEFLFSANKGEPAKPLAKVISGGEMSRFMLAIKNVTAKVENIPTMIFDEIDSGISGNIAKMVAKKLKSVSKDYQCIVVTHLSQLAAIAQNNVLIEKHEESGRTVTTAKTIETRQEKIQEVARLMGGIGEYSLLNAEDLINWGKSCD